MIKLKKGSRYWAIACYHNSEDIHKLEDKLGLVDDKLYAIMEGTCIDFDNFSASFIDDENKEFKAIVEHIFEDSEDVLMAALTMGTKSTGCN